MAQVEKQQETSKLVANDQHEIAYRHWAITEDKPKALVHIIHGMSEHSKRYEAVAKALNQSGFHVAAHDHRGHGYSATKPEALGHFADSGGWAKLLEDIHTLHTHFKQQYGNLPIILLGHSMGSFISLNYAQSLIGSKKIDALILSGSTVNLRATDFALKIVSKIERKRQGKRGRSALIDELTFGQFNRAFKPNRTESDWLTRDETIVDQYIEDPLSGFRCTNQTWYDLTSALLHIFQTKELKKISPTLPIYLVYGDEDPLGGQCGNKHLEKKLRAAGIKPVTRRGYADARHEILNETNKATVIQELIQWLEANIPS